MADRKNAYLCLRCHGCTFTVDVDEGTAPDKIACRANGFGLCPGTAISLGYPELLQRADIEPEWELYRLYPARSVQSTENRAVALACELLTIRARQAVGS